MSDAADPLSALAQLEGVPSALRSTRDAVDAVLTDRGLRRVDPEQQAAARIAGARASVDLQLRADDRDPDRLTEAGLRLYAELPELATALRRRPPQVLARVHLLLARGFVGEADLGRYTDGAVAERMRGLHDLLRSAGSAPALLLAAVAHAEVATAAPFGFADAMIGRAVEHMVLIDAGVDPLGVILPEVGHLESAEEYGQALGAYRSGTTVGVRRWILHCAHAVTRGAERSPVHSDRS